MYHMSGTVAGVLSSLDRVLLDAGTIQRRVADMAREIVDDFAGRELSVVTLMDGALFFVADLLRSIDLPVRLHTLTVSSYHGGTSSTGRVLAWPAVFCPGTETISGTRADSSKQLCLNHSPCSPRW